MSACRNLPYQGLRSGQSLVSYNSKSSTSQPRVHNCSQVLSRTFSFPANNYSSHQKLLSNPRRSRPNKWQRNRSSVNALFKTWKLFSTVHALKSIWNWVHHDFGRLTRSSTFFSLFIIPLNYFTGCWIQALEIFDGWRLTVNFLVIWRLTVNPIETLECVTDVLTTLLTSSVIYYWTDPRQHGIYLFDYNNETNYYR